MRFRGAVPLGLALSLAAAMFGCGGDDASQTTESGLSPGGASSGQNAGQGGASSSIPSASGGSGAAAGSASTERPPVPAQLDMGSSGSGNSAEASAGDAGSVEGDVADAGAALTPPAFNPCPTDGSACVIMPLGDSITDGLVGNAPGNTGQSVGGYRVELFRQALADGHQISFVGRNLNGPNDVDGQPFPRNHEGYSGATISTGANQLANRVDAALAASSPDIILLHIGTNNLYQGLPAEVPQQLASLLDQITDGAPDALVVVAQITPLSPTAFANNGVDQYNALIPGLVRERVDAGKHLVVVDMNEAFRAAGANVADLVGDNIHPTAAGYGIMAQTWYTSLENLLP
jgi:lysophospholipase L1-like esterase